MQGNIEAKPLFIPLKTEFFEAFERGEKNTEYRMYGARWNERTCFVGRRVVLSHGYGSKRRLYGIVRDFQASRAVTLREDWRECYGVNPRAIAACIRIEIIKAVV